jgi:NAD+ kinase
VRERVGRARARGTRRLAAHRDRGRHLLSEPPPRRIALAFHPRRDVESARAIVERWAADARIELCDEPDGADLLLALGGDGTMLGALRRGAPLGIPVLAANLGRLGYLTEVDEAGLPAALEALAAGRFAIEERVALEARWDDGSRVAYNDVVLSRTPGQGRAALGLHVDGQLLVRYASSGVIIATPMGSTAYSFAAGGPIISPQTRAMVVTPDAPHGLFNRAVVLGDDERVGVEVLASSGRVALEIDGQLVTTVEPGWSMEVAPHGKPARIVRLGDGGFAERARRKLGIMDPAAVADPGML